MTQNMAIRNWDRLSRDHKIRALARGDGPERQCPACGRKVHVVMGYWTQHSDPQSWAGRPPLRQCENELQPYAGSQRRARVAAEGQGNASMQSA